MSDGGGGEVPVPAAQPALSSSLSDSVELRDVTLILLINTPVTITLLLVFYLLRVWRKQRLSHNPLIEHNIQGRPLVGYDLGKDNIWKVWSRIWNVDLDTVTVRCGVHAATFLRFNKLITMLMFYATLFMLPTLLYQFSKGTASVGEYGRITLSVIESSRENDWWHVTLIVVCSSVVGCLFISQFIRHIKLVYLLGRTRAPVANFGVQVDNFPKYCAGESDTAKLNAELQKVFKSELVAAHIAPDLTRVMDAETEVEMARDLLEYYQTCPPGTVMRDSLFGNKVEAVPHMVKVVAELEAKLSSERRAYEARPTGTGFVFITFNEVRAARVCLTDMRSGKLRLKEKYSGPDGTPDVTTLEGLVLNAKIAPNPDDIQWRNLGVSRYFFLARRLVIYLLIAGAVFAWSTAVMVMTVAPELSGVRYNNLGAYFADMAAVPYPASTIVFRYFPPLALLTAGLYIADLFEITARLERQASRSEEERSVLKSATTVQILNSLLLPCFWLLYFGNLASYPDKSWADIATTAFFSGNATFFLHLLIHAATIGSACRLIRVGDWLSDLLGLSSSMSARAALKGYGWGRAGAAGGRWISAMSDLPPFFRFASEYSNLLTIFAVTFVLSPETPLAIPVGFLTLLIRYFVNKFNFLYVYTNRSAGDGHTPQSAAYSLLFIVMIFLGLFGAFLVARGLSGQAALVGTTMALVLALHFWNMFARSKIDSTPIELGETSIAEDSVDLQALRISYMHPSLISAGGAATQH